MSSVDGRLIDSRWTAPYKAEHGELLKVYSAIGKELDTDAWMFGKNTLRALFPYKFGITGHGISPDTPTLFVGERRSARLFIACDPEGDLYFTSTTIRGDNILVIVGRKRDRRIPCPSARIAHLIRHSQRCDPSARRA